MQNLPFVNGTDSFCFGSLMRDRRILRACFRATDEADEIASLHCMAVLAKRLRGRAGTNHAWQRRKQGLIQRRGGDA